MTAENGSDGEGAPKREPPKPTAPKRALSDPDRAVKRPDPPRKPPLKLGAVKASASPGPKVWWLRAAIGALVLAAGSIAVGLFTSLDDDPIVGGIPLARAYRTMTLGAIGLLAIAFLALSRLAGGAKIAIGAVLGYAALGTVAAMVWGRDAVGVAKIPIWVRPATVATLVLVAAALLALADGGEWSPTRRGRIRSVLVRLAALLALAPAALGITQLVRLAIRSSGSSAPAEVASAAPSASSAAPVVEVPPEAPAGSTPEEVRPDVPKDVDRHGDPLPLGAVARLGTLRYSKGSRLENHAGGGAISYAPDGKTLASMGKQGLTLWNAETGKQEVELARADRGATPTVGAECTRSFAFTEAGASISLPGDAVWKVPSGERTRDLKPSAAGRSVVHAPDGTSFAVVGAGGACDIYDVRQGKAVATVKFSRGADAVAFSPDSQRLASIGDGTIEVRETTTNKEVFKVKVEGKAKLRGLAYAPAGDSIATMVSDGGKRASVRIHDASTGQERWKAPEAEVGALAFSSDGKSLAAWGDQVVVWDVVTKAEKVRKESVRASCLGFAFSADGALIAVATPAKADASRAGGVSVLETQTGKERFSVESPHAQGAVQGLAFAPNGGTLAVSRTDGIHLVDTSSGKPTSSEAERQAHWGKVVAVAVSPDGQLVATRADGDAELRVWKTTTGEPVSTIATRGGRPEGQLVFSPDGTTLAAQDGSSVKIWKAPKGEVVASLEGEQMGDRLAFSVDGGLLVEGGLHARLWDPKSGRMVRTLDDPKNRAEATAVTFSKDGKDVLVASYSFSTPPSQKIAFFDANDGKPKASIDAPERLNTMVVTSDGATLLGCLDGTNATLWDLGTKHAKRRVGGLRLPVADASVPFQTAQRCALSSDGKRLAVGIDASLRIVNLETNEMSTLPAHRKDILGLAWSSDGRYLVTASADSTALVWDAAAIVSSKPEKVPTSSVPLAATRIAFVPGRDAFAWAGPRGGGVWDLGAWESRHAFEPGVLTHVAVSGDGKRIAVAGAGKSGTPGIRILDAGSAKVIKAIEVREGVRSLAVAPDGSKAAAILTPTGKSLLRVFGAAKGEELASTTASDAVGFLTDGTGVLAFGSKQSLVVFEPTNAKARTTMTGQPEAGPLLAPSPDGSFVATASRGSAPIRIWDPKAGSLLRSSSENVSAVALAVSTHGVVAVAADDGTLRLYAGRTAELMSTLRVSWPVTDVAFSSDGRKLAATVQGKTGGGAEIFVWDLEGH